MKYKTIQKKSDKELQKELLENRKLAQASRFGSAGSKNRNTKEGKNLRKNVARILTEITKRKYEQNN